MHSGVAESETNVITWNVPGAPFRIQVHREVLIRIEVDLALASVFAPFTKTDLPKGLLVGERGEVLQARSVEPSDSSALSKPLELLKAQLGSSPLADSIVGFYRISLNGSLAPTDEDLALIRTHFPEPENIFLIVGRVSPDTVHAGVYYWRDGAIEVNCEPVPLPVAAPNAPPPVDPPPTASSVRAGSELTFSHFRPLELAEEAADSELLPTPNRRGIARPRFVLNRKLSAILAGGGLILASVGIVFHRGAPATTPPSQAEVKHSPLLHVSRASADMVVNWNRDAEAVKNAAAAVLSIQDGPSKRQLHFTYQQLQSGSVVYAPVTDSVLFSMEFVTKSGKKWVENVWVMNGKPRPHDAISSKRKQPDATILANDGIAAPKRVTDKPAPDKSPTAVSVRQYAATSKGLRAFVPPVQQPASSAYIPPIPAAPMLSFARPEMHSPVLSVVATVLPPHIAPAQSEPSASHPVKPNPASAVSRVSKPATGKPTYFPPVALKQVAPAVPFKIKALLSREVRVNVQVSLDRNGRIMHAVPIAADGTLDRYLAGLAAETIRLWQFQPARRGDQNVPGDLVVQFSFIPVR